VVLLDGVVLDGVEPSRDEKPEATGASLRRSSWCEESPEIEAGDSSSSSPLAGATPLEEAACCAPSRGA